MTTRKISCLIGAVMLLILTARTTSAQLEPACVENSPERRGEIGCSIVEVKPLPPALKEPLFYRGGPSHLLPPIKSWETPAARRRLDRFPAQRKWEMGIRLPPRSLAPGGQRSNGDCTVSDITALFEIRHRHSGIVLAATRNVPDYRLPTLRTV
jgi:hypothetical protein